MRGRHTIIRDAMNTVSPAIEELARRLLAIESSHGQPPGALADRAARVCERLRGPLSKLAGPVSYRSLLSRALALAKVGAPSLATMRVGADGCLERSGEVRPDEHAGDAERAPLLLVAQLLGLLVTFIGEPLTQTLVRDAWPDEGPEGIDLGINAKS